MIMNKQYYRPLLMLLFMASLPFAYHTNQPTIADAIHPLDNENITYGQFTAVRSPSATSVDCVLPYCYDIINKTVNNSQKQQQPHIGGEDSKSQATPPSVKVYESERLMSDSYVRRFATIDDQHWASTSLMYGLLMLDTKDFVNERCYNELRLIYNGIRRKEAWAIKVLDSSGSPEPGFILGHNFWLGSIKGCEAVRKPHTITISNRFQRHMHNDLLRAKAPFDINYRVVYASHKSPWQIQVEFLLASQKILHVGLCLPTSCSDNEIKNISQQYFDQSLLQAQRLFEHQPDVLLVKDLNIKSNFMDKISVQLLGGCLIFSVVMMLLAHLINARNKDMENECGSYEKNPNNIRDKSSVEQTIQCFSLVDNFNLICSMGKSPNAIPVVDGLKSIGCFLILIFHMNWFMHYTVHNQAMMFAYGEETLWQWVGTTPIIVDIFFTISGLLLAYNFLRNESKIKEIQSNNLWKNIRLFFKQLLYRYMRLTPLYLIVVGATEVSTTYLVETSPFWVHERYDRVCKKFWWRNIFYIQNLFHVDDLCVNWTWSMACEMQFFVIFTALLFLYAKNQNVAKKLFGVLFAAFSVLVLAIALKNEFTPSYDVMHMLGNALYIAPWSRIIPYLVGVAAGWILFTTKGVMPFKQNTIKMLWTLTVSIAIMSHLSTINRDVSYKLAAPLIAAIRIFYSSSVAWMILSSAMGHGGIFAKILNFPVFVHLNKLSYGIYLLNPLIIAVIYGTKDHSTHLDPMSAGVMSIGVMFIVYLFSLAFSLLFEVPFTKLSSQLLADSKKKKLN